MANLIGDYMDEHGGTKFIKGKVPTSLEKTPEGQIKVTWDDGSEIYDTVMCAIGRDADTKNIGLENIGVEIQ